jgi:tetratricopeptide (TPR) repeat protein
MVDHITSEDSAMIDRLESVDPEAGPIEELLRLGQLYLEPAHRESDAVRLFESLLVRDPSNAWAKFWLAYCLIKYVMDADAVGRGRDVLGSAIDATDDAAAAASLALLAESLGDDEDSLGDRIRLLERSVRRRPDWVHNRQSLGWEYERAGRLAEALDQLLRARRNIVQPDPRWDSVTRNFEESVSGRIGYGAGDRIASDERRVRTRIGARP